MEIKTKKLKKLTHTELVTVVREEMLKNEKLIEYGRGAIRELDRVNNVKDGRPLVSHGLMLNLRKVFR